MSVDAVRGSAASQSASHNLPFERGQLVVALEWVLRGGVCLCFVGHGVFGLIGKEAWVPYFAVVGIGRESAYRLMPLVGTLDILLGALALVRPRPALLAYMSMWAVWTAALRPLSGDSFWEALERAGNYGVPLVLLLLMWPTLGLRATLFPAARRPLSAALAKQLRALLVATSALLLLGHGALGVLGKKELASHYALLGLSSSGASLSTAIGWTEIGFAAALLVRQPAWYCLFLVTWKLATESLFLAAGSPIWEVVERGGSYAAPLALMLLVMASPKNPPLTPRELPGS
jgi:hypothetical protein